MGSSLEITNASPSTLVSAGSGGEAAAFMSARAILSDRADQVIRHESTARSVQARRPDSSSQRGLLSVCGENDGLSERFGMRVGRWLIWREED
jgi:hypothetical protein